MRITYPKRNLHYGDSSPKAYSTFPTNVTFVGEPLYLVARTVTLFTYSILRVSNKEFHTLQYVLLIEYGGVKFINSVYFITDAYILFYQ